VRNGYLQIAAGHPQRVVVVNGVQERDEIHAEIVQAMRDRLGRTE
jgi:thymidylate kinase